jgi:lambda family phage portal protein
MDWLNRFKSALGFTPLHEASGWGRRAMMWRPSNSGPVATQLAIGPDLLIKSRDIVRRNAIAFAGVEAVVANAIGTGIKPQSMVTDAALRERIQALWREWVEEADHDGLTDLYGLQSGAMRSMVEGGECLIKLVPQTDTDSLVPLKLQLLEPELLPTHLNTMLPDGGVIRSGIEFDAKGKRVAYHLYPHHPNDGVFPMSGESLVPIRVDAAQIVHLFRPLRPGQIRGEPWLSRALVKLSELDQYDDAELVRKKTSAMFLGFITRNSPEENLMGEGAANQQGIALAGMEPGTMQVLEPGEDIKFSSPADVGGQYSEFLRMQYRSVAAAMGCTYEQLTGDLTQVNYSSIRAGLLEFRRRIEAIQHGVLVHQMCRPIWRAWMDQAVLSGALDSPDYLKNRRQYLAAKWVPQGWQWVDPLKETNAMLASIRAGLMSRSEAISSVGYDAEDVDNEIALDNARADGLGLRFDSDPRWDKQARVPVDKAAQDQQQAD